ncbi:hypothetical protein [Nocardia niwae]|uniref:hypothetical protein n=1 Tax=Nocardia niwae TaxID=626084 RepID=UPI00340FB7F9
MTLRDQPRPYVMVGRALIAIAAWASTRDRITVDQLFDNTDDRGDLRDFGAELLQLLHLHGVEVDIEEFRQRAWMHFNEEWAAPPTLPPGPEATTDPRPGRDPDAEYAFDTYMLATLKVKAPTLSQARRKLHALGAHDVPDAHAAIADGVEMTVLEYRGIADMPHVVPGQRGEFAPENSGFAQLERMATANTVLPMLFRVVQVSPEGKDMQEATMETLDEYLRSDRMVRVGLARAVCLAEEVSAPEIVVRPGGEFEVVTPGWQVLSGFSRRHGYNGPLMEAYEPINERLAGRILSHPGLYVVLSAYDGAGSWIVLYRDDSEEILEAFG